PRRARRRPAPVLLDPGEEARPHDADPVGRAPQRVVRRGHLRDLEPADVDPYERRARLLQRPDERTEARRRRHPGRHRSPPAPSNMCSSETLPGGGDSDNPCACLDDAELANSSRTPRRGPRRVHVPLVPARGERADAYGTKFAPGWAHPRTRVSTTAES